MRNLETTALNSAAFSSVHFWEVTSWTFLVTRKQRMLFDTRQHCRLTIWKQLVELTNRQVPCPYDTCMSWRPLGKSTLLEPVIAWEKCCVIFYNIYRRYKFRGQSYYWKTNSEILKTKRSVFIFTQSRSCKTNFLGHPLTESLHYRSRANRCVPLAVGNFTPPTPKGTP